MQVLDLRFPGYFAFSWGWYDIGLCVWILVVVKHVPWQDLVFARLGSVGVWVCDLKGCWDCALLLGFPGWFGCFGVFMFAVV